MARTLPICHHRWIVRFTWWFAKLVTGLITRTHLQLTVVGRHHLQRLPTTRPIVFAVVGHESYYDGFLFAELLPWWSPFLPPSFAAYTTVYQECNGWLGLAMAALGCAPVPHQRDRTVVVSSRQLVERLRAGWPIALFVDAGWNERDDGTIARSIAQLAKLARRYEAVVVPVRLTISEIDLATRLPRFRRQDRPMVELTVLPVRPIDRATTEQTITSELLQLLSAPAETALTLADTQVGA